MNRMTNNNAPALKTELDFLTKKLEENIQKSPYSYRSYLLLIDLNRANSQIFDQFKIIDAETVANKAIKIAPKNPFAYWSLISIEISMKNFQQAIDLAKRVIEIEPELEKSYQLLIKAAKFQGNVDLVNDTISKAIKINPSWENDLKSI